MEEEKAKMERESFTYAGIENFPNDKCFSPEITHFDAVYDGKHWYITDLHHGGFMT